MITDDPSDALGTARMVFTSDRYKEVRPRDSAGESVSLALVSAFSRRDRLRFDGVLALIPDVDRALFRSTPSGRGCVPSE